MTQRQQSARHLAARAVVAYRTGIPVALLSLATSSDRISGIVCDWKGQRGGVVEALTGTDPFAHAGDRLLLDKLFQS